MYKNKFVCQILNLGCERQWGGFTRNGNSWVGGRGGGISTLALLYLEILEKVKGFL